MVKKFSHWKRSNRNFSYFNTTLIITLLFVITLRAEAFDFRIDGISYDITSATTCKVVSDEHIYKGVVSIPSEVSFNSVTYKVTAIGNQAFFNCEELTDISLPKSLETIEADAFSNCIALTSVTIPDNIRNVDKTSFTGANLQELYIGDCINQIGMAAFYFVPTVHLMSSITKINDVAFEDADGLRNIYIPNSIKEIEANAFAFCGNLQGVYIDDLANWCEIKFGNQYANPTSKAGEIWVNGNHITNLEIPDGVKLINDYAFYGCKQIYELKISDSVEKIGKSAFHECGSIPTLRIGSGLRYIGTDGIWGNGINTIYTDDINAFCQIDVEDFLFNQLYTTELIYDGKVVTKVTVDDNVNHIGKNVFRHYAKLASVSMPNSVTSIGESAFANCIGLVKITLSDSIKVLPSDVLSSTTNLSKLTLPTSLREIGSYALHGTGVQKIILPESTEKIGEAAFCNCMADSIILSDKITDINDRMFWECKNLKYVYLGSSLKTISGSCFFNCEKLESISLPSTMEHISLNDYLCPNLKKVYCNSLNPYPAYFPQAILQEATLYVPVGCKDAFLNDYVWGAFKEIIEIGDLGGIKEINVEFSTDVPFEIFDFNGRKVKGSIEELKTGIYILKQGRLTKKLIVK